MIGYTPHHQYTEIIDQKQAKNFTQKLTMIVITITIVTGIIYVLLLGIQYLPCWIMVPITIIMIFVLIIALIVYAILSYQPPSKAQVASVIKDVIGFDFGDDFKLLETSSHDYEEYLYIFSESSFEPLKKHLDSIPNKDGQAGERSIKHQINGADFYLCDNRMKGVCGNIETIKVDYQERTLKHTFTVY